MGGSGRVSVNQPGRVDRQPAYVLHAQPYRETSLLVEVLSRDHGRFLAVARGARRPRSDLRGLLLPFQPLTLSWFGKGELRTLHCAEWDGGVPQMSGLPLVCGFYLNELMIKLTARDDPEPRAFSVYDTAVRGLACHSGLTMVLRRYELRLIQVLGYAPSLHRDAYGAGIHPDVDYWCQGNAPPERDVGHSLNCGLWLSGASLLAIEADDYGASTTRVAARALMRLWLIALLGKEALASRELLRAVHSLSD